MCRPIESRGLLMGPNALFGGLAPSTMVDDGQSSSGLQVPVMGKQQQQQQQPQLPFQQFPKFSNVMPTASYPMGTNETWNNSYSNGYETQQQQQHQMMNTGYSTSNSLKQEVDELDINNFDDLLDYSIPEGSPEGILGGQKEVKKPAKEESFKMDEDFDSTEMSILYSFLLDAQNEPKQSGRKDSLDLNDDGMLSINLLDDTPLDSLVDCMDDMDDLSTIELKPPSDCYLSKGEEPFLFEGSLKPESFKKSRRLCKIEGCSKRSRSHGLCIAHGGGRRCSVEGCNKSSQGGNLCIRHGGGKRCNVAGCNKAAQSNMLCKAHGGGPRCQYKGCNRSSQGGGFCRSHGGGKRCLFAGCDKGTQRGDYCALHGGSRLCGVPGCTRNDRGGGYCATHGGGKRCSMEGCMKPCRRKGMCSAHLRQLDGSL